MIIAATSLSSILSTWLLVAPVAASSFAPEDRRCAEMDLRPPNGAAPDPGDGPSLQSSIADADAEELDALLGRVGDRLERWDCFQRAREVLALARERAELLADAGDDVAELQAKIELVAIRVDYRARCPSFTCGESDPALCPAVAQLTELVADNPQIAPARFQTWLSGAPGDPEPLSCLFETATTACPLPVVGTRVVPNARREIIIGASSAGLAVGVAAVILGSVLLAIHQDCPGGIPATECSQRFSTVEEGAVTIGLGGAALIGAGLGLGIGLRRVSGDAAQPGALAQPIPQSSRARATGWAVSLGWTLRF